MPRQRYRRYLEPESNVRVPRQTISNAAKRARTSDILQNESSASGSTAPGVSVDNVGSHTSFSADDATAAEVNTSHQAGEVLCESDHVDDSFESMDTEHCTSQRADETLSDIEDVYPSGNNENDGAEEHADKLPAASDDFPDYFKKLSEEKIPHSNITKAQVLLLVLAYVRSIDRDLGFVRDVGLS
ncbi:hypothetical protein HPB50_027966 [Hyalomma asiaticum]|nr:hypothetical protein HPB50_027966 [Hyalomma asiaticum]